MLNKTISMRSFILLMLVPILLIIITLLTTLIYRDLYQIIQNGFDKKLLSIGRGVSTFIKGEDIPQIQKYDQFRSIAFDSKRNLLHANYFIPGRILSIQPQTGLQQEIPIDFEYLEDLAYHPIEDALYSVSNIEFDENFIPIESALIRIDLNTFTSEEIMIMNNGCYGVVYKKNTQQFFCNDDENLFEIDVRKKRIINTIPMDLFDIRSLTYHPEDKFIYGMHTSSNSIIKIDIKNEEEPINSVGTLFSNTASLNRADFKLEQEVFLFGTFGLTYNPLTKKFYGSTTSPLITIDVNNKKDMLIPTEYWQYQNNAQKASRTLYEQYLIPMVHIQNRNSVTFLFALEMFDRGEQTRYILDTYQEAIHSFNGLELPAEDKELSNVWFKGETFLKEIWWSPDWNLLLKSSYLPVYSNEAQITALTGADVNVEIIKSKTKDAIYIALLIGAFMVVIAISISIGTAKKLTRPIEIIKNTSIEISSGNFGYQCEKTNFLELQEVVNTLNKTSSTLQNTIEELNQSNTNIKETLYKQMISQHFITNYNHLYNYYNKLDFKSYIECNKKITSNTHNSSFIGNKNFSILWHGFFNEDLFSSIEQKHLLSISVSNVLKKENTLNNIKQSLDSILSHSVHWFMILEHSSNKCYIYMGDNNSEDYSLITQKKGELQNYKLNKQTNNCLEIPFEGMVTLYNHEQVELSKPESFKELKNNNDVNDIYNYLKSKMVLEFFIIKSKTGKVL